MNQISCKSKPPMALAKHFYSVVYHEKRLLGHYKPLITKLHRSNRPEVFCKKGVLKRFCKIHRETSV